MTRNPDPDIVPAVYVDERHEPDRQFVLHPSDDDIFVRTGRQIIEACRLRISLDVWCHEFEQMLISVQKWCGDNTSHLRSCICTPKPARVMLFFVPASDQFDFELADKLTELDLAISKDFQVGMVEVSQIPWDQVDRFVVARQSRQVYGEHPESHHSVGTQS